MVRSASRARHGRVVGRDRADAPDVPALEVDVVQVAVRPELELDRVRRARHERLDVAGIRQSVRAAQHRPDAVAAVVGEEQRPVIGGWEAAGRRREGEAGDRRGADAARLAGHDARLVVVRVVGRRVCGRAGAVERLAEVQVDRVVALQATRALVARPAEVAHRRRWVGHAVDLLPVVPADLAEPDLVGAGTHGDAERVAEAVGDDPAGIGIARARVVRQRVAGVRVHAQDGSAEPGGVGGRAHVLGPESTALRGGRRLGAADTRRRVPARVARNPLLPPVGDVVVRALPGADVQRAVGAERQRADRMARVLLAPVLDQDLLEAAAEARQAAGHDTAVLHGARRRGALVTPAGERRRVRVLVVRVEDIDVRAPGREAGVESESEQSAVPEVVDLPAEVGIQGRRRVAEVLEDLDPAALLGDEDPAVGREADGRRLLQAAQRDRVLEAGRRRGGSRKQPLGRVRDVEVGLRGGCEQRRQHDQHRAAPQERHGEDAMRADRALLLVKNAKHTLTRAFSAQ